jgi:nicotinate-nucleotide adenylyltransferase
MRIGIFGGTFDPPHLGHLILAAEAHYQLNLDRLLWVLTPDPPHKTGRKITSVADRLAMVEAAVLNDPRFEISRIEIDREGPHYAIETVQLLRKAHPGDELIYLVGGDSLQQLNTWYRPHDFIKACDALGVMHRPVNPLDMDRLEAQAPGITSKVRFLDAPLLEISSRELRRRIALGGPYQYYLPPEVVAVIEARNLYRN